MRINKLHNLAVTVSFVAALMACGVSLAASSTFTAATDDDNNGYNGTVTAGGDGYAFTAEDSARYYKFLYLNDDLLLDGAVCAGSTNWYTANIGTYTSHPVTVTVTNGARMVTQRNRDIMFKGKGGTIVVSEPTDAPYTWAAGSYSTTVLGDKTLANIIGTVGYSSKFTLCSDVTSDTGTNDILRLLAHGTASYQFVSNENATVAARILFEGGELRAIYDDATKFHVADGAKIILQSVDGNPIRLCNFPYDSSSLFTGAGMLETAGNGDFILLQQPEQGFKMRTLTLGADEGGSNDGNNNRAVVTHGFQSLGGQVHRANCNGREGNVDAADDDAQHQSKGHNAVNSGVSEQVHDIRSAEEHGIDDADYQAQSNNGERYIGFVSLKKLFHR
jgi:hypothetical protein